jgi:hypothetical protein
MTSLSQLSLCSSYGIRGIHFKRKCHFTKIYLAFIDWAARRLFERRFLERRLFEPTLFRIDVCSNQR